MKNIAKLVQPEREQPAEDGGRLDCLMDGYYAAAEGSRPIGEYQPPQRPEPRPQIQMPATRPRTFKTQGLW